MAFSAFVLAAGEGTRMKSAHPKTTHTLLGRPLVAWSVLAAREAGAERVVVVTGAGASEVTRVVEPLGCEVVEQAERLGTGHATRVAQEATGITEGVIVVLYGDSPLLRAKTIRALVERVTASDALAAALLTMEPPDPSGYGRIVLDKSGKVEAIIEDKDATPDERERLRLCNPGVYAFDASVLARTIGKLKNENAQGEYYLTDLIGILHDEGLAVAAVPVEDDLETLGVNSRSQLAEATKIMQRRINAKLMAQGVTMIDPDLVWVGPDCEVGTDSELWPMTFLFGATIVGKECRVGPNTRLTNVVCGDHCVLDETVAQYAEIEDEVSCGPRAYLRPGTTLKRGAHIGTSVEIKNSTVGEGSKVPHLSYIGDTTMGSGVNIGAASVTCNYDGVSKHRTTIGDDVFIGSDTMMVAPVHIGNGAITGAASCITRDVPPDALALERNKQQNIEGYAKARRLRRERE